jgi:hypothetical protein
MAATTLVAQFLVVALRVSTAVVAPPSTPRRLTASGSGEASSAGTAAAAPAVQRFEPFVEAAYPAASVGVQVERVERFCFPDADTFSGDGGTAAVPGVPAASPAKKRNVSFTFVLTDGDGRKCFGFCRRFQGDRDTNARPLCLALLSTRAWFSVFVPLLERIEAVYGSGGLPAVQQVVDYLNMKDIAGAVDRQQRFVTHVVPLPDGSLHELRAPRVSDNALDDVPYVTLFKTLFVANVLQVFEALLLERRVIFVSKDYTRLSHCIFGVASLLFPFQWQHIFIPILPRALLDVCCAPMPFVVGVHASCMPQLQRMPLESTVFVDLDSNSVTDTAASAINAVADEGAADADEAAKPIADSRLPMRYVDRLRADLEKIVAKKSNDDPHALAAPFMTFFVTIFHSYAQYLVLNVSGQRLSSVSGVKVDGEKAELRHMFGAQRFIRHHPSRACANFLTRFCQCQMFEQFIYERLEQLETSEHVSSQFDAACDAYNAQHRDPSSSTGAAAGAGAGAASGGGPSTPVSATVVGVAEDNYAAVKKQMASTGERLLGAWRNTQKRFSPSAAAAAPSPARTGTAAGSALAATPSKAHQMERSVSVDSMATAAAGASADGDDDSTESNSSTTADPPRSIARESAPNVATPVARGKSAESGAAAAVHTIAVKAAAATPQPPKAALLIDLFGDDTPSSAAQPSRAPSAPLPTPAARATPAASLFDLDDVAPAPAAAASAATNRQLFGSPTLLDMDLLDSVQPFKRRDGQQSGEASPSGSSLLDMFGAPAAPHSPSEDISIPSTGFPANRPLFSLLDL